jgi:hypothetical protein
MTDKYEKVEYTRVDQLVHAHMNSDDQKNEKDQFYITFYDPPRRIDFEKLNVFSVSNWLDRGLVARKLETPWWEKHVGGLVMVRDSDNEAWHPAYFESHLKYSDYPFKTRGSTWKQARPLTKAEKDAIITEG